MWHSVIWQFYHSRIEVLQIAQPLALVIFVLVSLMGENLRGLRENSKNKIRSTDLPDGQIYTGNFANWTKFGEGNLTWRNGDVFQGIWTDNEVGNGTITYSDGTLYIGQWLGDKRHGKGEMRYTHGGKYVGHFSNGLKDGIGNYTWSDGAYYSGQFKNDR